MRSPYDEYSAVVTDSGGRNATRATNSGYINHSSNNNDNSNSSAIPYHARENSLPFSYGQINKMTPLRSVNAGGGVGSGGIGAGGSSGGGGGVHDFGTVRFGSSAPSPTKADVLNSSDQHYYGTNYNNNYNKSSNSNGLTATLKSTTTDKTNANATTIKSQPRLTSPILVRKTLNSRSPTRSNGSTTNTNTIANTYPYKYGSDNDDNIFSNGVGVGVGVGSYSGRDNTLNGNISNFGSRYSNNNNINNNLYGSTKKYGSSSSNNNSFDIGKDSGDTIDGTVNVRKTQPREDFEELLRERREKVIREHYRSAGATTSATTSNGWSSAGSGDAGSGIGISPTARKYNYDFEFHLNLDDDVAAAAAAPQPPRRGAAHTVDRSSAVAPQQYRSYDSPVSTTYVERNYHTTSVSPSREIVQQLRQPQQPQLQRQQFESLYSTVEKRTLQPAQRQQYSPSLSPRSPTQAYQQQQQQQRRLEYTTYGNGNASGYGFDSSNNNNISNHEYGTNGTNNRSSLGAAVVARSRHDSSAFPIYATTTKQQQRQHQISTATSSLNTSYGSSLGRNTFEPDLSFTDHPFAVNAAVGRGTGTISPSPQPSHILATRPETPAFPVTPRTPHGGYSGQNSPMGGYSTHSHSPLPPMPSNGTKSSMLDLHNYSSETIYRTNCRPRFDSNNMSTTSSAAVNSEPQEVAAHLVKFAKDSSKYWYKPNLSREEAVQLLLHAEPGTFVVRNSTTYKDNYGLVLRVHQPPPNSELTGQPDDLVRHFLIEPTKHGVRLKSCANEPVFTSLSALIYEHSINKLALPCLLRIPDHDLVPSRIEPTSAQKQLLTQGAACNVLWLFSCDTESLTGEEAIRKTIREMYGQKTLPVPTEVHFKVTQQGITLTDNTRKKFFRKHYPADSISFCAIDPDHRLWSMHLTNGEDGKSAKNTLKNNSNNANTSTTTTVGALKKTIFAFVARSSPKSKDNECHVFCDLDIHQPASAIVSFVNKTLPSTELQRNYVL